MSRPAAPPNPVMALARAMLAAQEKAERKKKPETAPEPVKKKRKP